MSPFEGHSQAEFLVSQLEHNGFACVQTHVHIQIYAKKVHKYEYSYSFIYIHFLISFLVLVLNQLWILRGHFLCCRSLMKLQGTPYCSGVVGGEKKTELELYIHSSSKKHFELSSFKIYFSIQSIWAVWACCQAPTTCSDETVWNGCPADKYPGGAENSLFLLHLGKNKESEVLEQHEAHYQCDGSAHSWGYDGGQRVVHHPHCRH